MIISVIYDDIDQATYEGIEVSHQGKSAGIFHSGNIENDFQEALTFALSNKNEEEGILYSSTCDHFVMDGSDYEWFTTINDIPTIRKIQQ